MPLVYCCLAAKTPPFSTVQPGVGIWVFGNRETCLFEAEVVWGLYPITQGFQLLLRHNTYLLSLCELSRGRLSAEYYHLQYLNSSPWFLVFLCALHTWQDHIHSKCVKRHQGESVIYCPGGKNWFQNHVKSTQLSSLLDSFHIPCFWRYMSHTCPSFLY